MSYEFFLELIDKLPPVSLKDIGGFIRDIVVASTAIWAAWAANKGLNKYLLDEDIKERTKKIRNANDVAHEVAHSIINEIESIGIRNRVASEGDLTQARDWAEKLCTATRGASSPLQTLAYLLKQLMLSTKHIYEYSESFEKIPSTDILNIVYVVARKIQDDSTHIIDLPKYPKKTDSSRRRFEAGDFLLKESIVRYSSGRFGIDLRPHSNTAFEFYSIVISVTNSKMLKLESLRVLRSNIPAILKLFDKKIYVPPILAVDEESGAEPLRLMGRETFFLYDIRRIVYYGEKQGVEWKIAYGTLDGGHKYSNGQALVRDIIENYHDIILESKEFVKEIDEYEYKYSFFLGELLEITVPDKNMKKLTGIRKWKLEQWLKRQGVRKGKK
ncbi:hypothetical protein [Halomonas binhaiensis]|uniref:Uncharacterized protein n=1 Tax=Halomonas binhaiensis TaxID=2562282 RepID=A0A5C1NBA4_9GAMM|nr:hypothetical protein [Halomonas binhaiensis]QEM80230.1 hypothetical protein E4T21_00645 [Halomonas binhaiensis]